MTVICIGKILGRKAIPVEGKKLCCGPNRENK